MNVLRGALGTFTSLGVVALAMGCVNFLARAEAMRLLSENPQSQTAAAITFLY